MYKKISNLYFIINIYKKLKLFTAVNTSKNINYEFNQKKISITKFPFILYK